MAKRQPPRTRTRQHPKSTRSRTKRGTSNTSTPAPATPAPRRGAPPAQGPVQAADDDMVAEASRESFPASDPPAWTRQHV